MYHKLCFQANFVADLQLAGKPRLERLMLKAGEIIEAKVQPYVHETEEGPVEYAELHLAGDGTLLAVPMECFRFM